MTSPLSDILMQLAVQSTGREHPLKITEFEQVILNLIAEAIGEDEYFEYIPDDMGEAAKNIRNHLRAEIRQKLGIPEKEIHT